VTLSVEDVGRGPGLVFVHGMWMSGRFFSAQVGHFAARRRVVVPDLRGHGDSGRPLVGHTIRRCARDLQALLDELDVRDPVLVGWSMGAMVCWEYLRTFGQDEVRGLVIVEQPPSDFAWPDYEFGAFTLPALRELIEGLQEDQRAVAEDFARAMLHEPDPDTIAWMTREILKVPPAVAATILVDETLQDYRSFLPRISVPTLVLFGEDDKLTDPRAGRFIADRVPGAELATFARSSHCPFVEEAPLFNATLDSFLERLEEGAARAAS
jgi:pimeloyl-ACP methyl ester carboxylesterase